MMGGSESTDFLAPAGRARTRLSSCENGDYSADIEIARAVPRAPEFPERLDAPEEIETPGVTTIEGLAELLGIDAAATSKAMPVVKADGTLVLALVRGDDRLSESKLVSLFSSDFRPAEDEEIRAVFGAGGGSLGPVGVEVEVIADETLREGQFVAGANATAGTCAAWRPAATTSRRFADIREPQEGDACPVCGGRLSFTPAIEVGHIFKLGTFYSEPLGAMFLDEYGKERPIVMGRYGIGPARIDVGGRRAARRRARDRLAAEHRPVRRPRRRPAGAWRARRRRSQRRSTARARACCSTTATSAPGEKFADADLIGIPTRITVGKKTLEDGAGGRPRPSDGRGAARSRRRSWKLGSNTTLARRRRFSTEPFGPTLERLMQEKGVTYRALADQTNLSAGYLNHLVHGNRPVPSDEIVRKLSKALGVEPEHFREYRLRLITQRLEQMPELIDRLYRRLER